MSNLLMILNDAKSIDVLKWCQINWWSQIVPNQLMISNCAKSIDNLEWYQIDCWS